MGFGRRLKYNHSYKVKNITNVRLADMGVIPGAIFEVIKRVKQTKGENHEKHNHNINRIDSQWIERTDHSLRV